MTSCVFCGSSHTRIKYAGEFHSVDSSFGPFDLQVCRDCGSLSTRNPPSTERLALFYREFERNRPDWYQLAARDNALLAQYEFYGRMLAGLMHGRKVNSWIDIGAGHGELANILANRAPVGRCVAADITPRPPRLSPKLDYVQNDFNDDFWGERVGRFDFAFSIAVWEHVADPARYLRQCFSTLNDGGLLVLLTPDYGSAARRLFGRSWPYFSPGEHLSMPTRRGALACARRACPGARVKSRPIWIGYSVRYVMSVLGARKLASLIPPGFALPVPAGALLTVIERRE